MRLLLVALFAISCSALQWSHNLPNNTTLTVCSGDEIHLLWNFTLVGKETVEDIIWVYEADGREGEMIAMMSRGNFLVMPAFSGRVRQEGMAGLVISGATLLESGHYSVEVSTDDAANPLAKFHRTMFVQVSEPPVVKHGQLMAEQSPSPVLDQSSGQWRLELTCGVLSSLGHPPVHAFWTTPEGHQSPSSSISNGTFHFLVDNPPSGGNYTCSLPLLSPAVHCLPPHSPLREGVAVNVDQTKASFSLLQAQYSQMQAQQRNNSAVIDAIQRENEKTKNSSAMEISQLKTEIASLTSKLYNATRQIGFHATLSDDIHIGAYQTVKPWVIHTNSGNCFNISTGEFSAPLDGFYFFVASTGSYAESHYANIGLQVENVGRISETWLSKYSSYWSMGSCHATVHLSGGQKVWLTPRDFDGYLDDHSTSFSGFLITADE